MYKRKIRELREQAIGLKKQADDIKERFDRDGVLSAEDEEQLDGIVDEAAECTEEQQRLEAKQAKLDDTFADVRSGDPSPTPPRRETEEQERPGNEPWRDALRRYVKARGRGGLSREEEQLYLRRPSGDEFAGSVTVDSLGAFTIPTVYIPGIIDLMTEKTRVRPLCRVVQTDSDNATFLGWESGEMPNSTTIKGQFRPPGQVTKAQDWPRQDPPLYRQPMIPIANWEPDAIELPPELIEDSQRDIVEDIMMALRKRRRVDEDAVLTIGDGQGVPLGLFNGGITQVKSGSASGLTYNGLVDLWADLDESFEDDATMMMSKKTLAAIMKLNVGDSDARPLFPVGGRVDRLFGIQPIVLNGFSPAIAANAEPILYGDFDYYAIADRLGLEITVVMQRTLSLFARSRFGGGFLATEPFRVQTIAA